jgi:FlaA1/EpsC-like NDP-sugar epimerase
MQQRHNMTQQPQHETMSVFNAVVAYLTFAVFVVVCEMYADRISNSSARLVIRIFTTSSALLLFIVYLAAVVYQIQSMRWAVPGLYSLACVCVHLRMMDIIKDDQEVMAEVGDDQHAGGPVACGG